MKVVAIIAELQALERIDPLFELTSEEIRRMADGWEQASKPEFAEFIASIPRDYMPDCPMVALLRSDGREATYEPYERIRIDKPRKEGSRATDFAECVSGNDTITHFAVIRGPAIEIVQLKQVLRVVEYVTPGIIELEKWSHRSDRNRRGN